MVVKSPICKKCGYVMDNTDAKECPICLSTKFTTFWQGYAIILDPEKSDVAKILNITNNGKFALRIN